MYRQLPDQVQTTLQLAQVKIIEVRKSVVEYFPELATKRPPGYTGNVTFAQVPGLFDPPTNTLAVATNPDPEAHGSSFLYMHEVGHAYDYHMGYISRTQTFMAAAEADYYALVAASPEKRYYTKPDDNGAHYRAYGETYAESFANYFSGKMKWFADKPNLLRFFRSSPMQPK